MLMGIFVGGASSRMGGTPKGLLPARDTGEPLVVRLARLGNELGFEPVLVGKADAYLSTEPTLRTIADEPPGVGPLGGLQGLLRAAQNRPVIAVACDMPAISKALLTKLARTSPSATVLAPKRDGRWEPLCARYSPFATLPLLGAALARGVRSFQQLFEAMDVEQLKLSHAEEAALVDWDSPEDVRH
jgi:molybdopterin-guanine dinucleotide biosynthesis protein A